MNTLQGKTALVTGGSRGFGRGIVESLVAQAMSVTAVARNPDRLAQLQADLNGAVETVSADVTDGVRAAQIMRRTRPDVLVLNAGTQAPYRYTRQHTWETFSYVWDVDMKGTFLWAREAMLQPLAEGSHIIIVSSHAALGGNNLIGGYCSVKAAQWAYARSLAQEAKTFNIRVHCLLPRLSPLTDLGQDAIETFAQHDGITTAQAIERFGLKPPLLPETVGQAVVDLVTAPQDYDAVHWVVGVTGLEAVDAAPARA